jgi:hypothetical protein
LLLASLDELLSLGKRNRAKEPRANLAPGEDIEKIRQIQEARSAKVRFGLNCYCKGAGTPMVPVGEVKAKALGFPRDYAICPVCSEGGSGSKGKVRYPRKKDLNAAEKLPPCPCRKCGSFVGLYDSLTVQLDSLSWQVYSCKSCTIPAAAMGPVKCSLEDFDKPKKRCRKKLESRSLPEF